MKRILILKLLLLSVLSLQAQYKWINPLPQGNTLHSVSVTNEDYIYAAGEHGTMIRSSNAGNDWLILDTETTRNLYGIYFLNKDYGYAVGDSGIILVSYNMGLDWQKQPSETESSLKAVHFTDSLNGVCCGEDGIILRTQDGGQNWETTSSGLTSTCFAIDFINTDTGFIAGENWDNYGFILKTDDGGANWSIIADSLSYGLFSIDCTPNGNIYTGGESSFLMRSLNNGLSWDTLINPVSYSPYSIMSISFLDDDTGYYGTVGGIFGKTNDAGLHWEIIEFDYFQNLYSISQTSGNAIIVGSSGMIFCEDEAYEIKLLSYGPTWNLHSIDKTDHDHIFITGINVLFRSIDAGLSWKIDTIPELEHCYSAQFLDSLTGYALAGSYVLKTNDGGETWEEQSLSKRADFLSGIHMIDQSIGYVFGGGYSPGGAHWGTLIKTEDGAEWNSVSCPGAYPVSSCYFLHPDKGFVMNFNGQMYMTQNGGNEWNGIDLAISDLRTINDMIFVGEEIGFAVGDRGQNGNIILKTTDGGFEWKLIYEDDNSPLYDFQLRAVNFLDSLNGYAVGTYGGILETHDGGDTWLQLASYTNHTLNAVLSIGETSGFIIGAYGCLVSFGESGLGIHDIQSITSSPVNAYPNPFKHKISFEIYSNVTEYINFELFDINGKRIHYEQINLHTGKQSLIIYPDNDLPSGAYIFTITGNNMFSTGKIIKSTN